MNKSELKLKQLIDTNHWLSVESTLLYSYPDQIESIDAYRDVFEKLKLIEPTETNITLFIRQDFDEETNELTFPNVYGESPDEEFGLALEFMTWDKWLGLTVSSETLKTYNELEIIAHCLYEMTYAGYDESEIQRELKNIEGIAVEYKGLAEEEKVAKTRTFEEILKQIENKKNSK